MTNTLITRFLSSVRQHQKCSVNCNDANAQARTLTCGHAHTQANTALLYSHKCTHRHSLNWIKENVRRASKENITIINATWNKIGNGSFGGFKRKRLSDWTDPPDLQVSQLTELARLFFQCKMAVKMTQRLQAAVKKEIISRSRTCHTNLCFVVFGWRQGRKSKGRNSEILPSRRFSRHPYPTFDLIQDSFRIATLPPEVHRKWHQIAQPSSNHCHNSLRHRPRKTVS